MAAATSDLASLSLETFAPHVGETFALVGTSHALILESADAAPSAGPRAAFALLFRGPLEPALTQQVHALEHETLGALDIFLVPVGREADGMRYEAVFA